MFCPRCGAESDAGSRYCASCGADLSPPKPGAGGAKERSGFKAWATDVIGGDRRTRMITLGTVAALLVAVGAFFALKADDGSGLPQDAYARAADAACVQHKEAIARAQRTALAGDDFAAVGSYAGAIVPIAGEWRQELGRGSVPPDRVEQVEQLSAALLEVQIEAGALTRVAREGKPREVAKTAAQMDAATANVEAAVDSLDLERCGELVIAGGQLVRQ